MINIIISAALLVGAVAAAVAITRYDKAVDEHNAEVRERGYGREERRVPLALSAVPLALAAVAFGLGCFYAQDAGDVVVLRDLGGNISGYTSETGFHAKLPWQDCITYDIRNNVITFTKDGSDDYMGGSATGSHVTVNDASGVSADMDIQVNYSLDPSRAVDIYRDYGTQENFVRSVAAIDARSVPREVAGRFDTITMLTDRGEFTRAVQDELAARWEGYGLTIEQVSVQEIRYPESVTSKYAEAQQALIDKEKAQNEQETAKVEAETKKIEAQGEADANAVLTQSLTPEVLQQRYIDALVSIGGGGNLVVVPEGSQPLVVSQR